MGERICSVQGCAAASHRRGWCQKHYVQYRKAGGPNLPKPSAPERFWAKVDRRGPVPECNPALGPCWIWLAGLSRKGYGSFNAGGRRTISAHRWAYEDAHGSLPLSAFELDHLCRVPRCVNPAHLEPVTHTVNMRRSPVSLATLNAARTHCPKGHEYAGENLYVSRRGHRQCRACRRAGGRDNYRRRIEGRLGAPGRPRTARPETAIREAS